MENNIPLELNQPRQTSPQKHLHPKIWVPVLIVFAAAVGYLVWARESKEWPFVGKNEELRIENEEGVEGWQTYRNEEYGFEIKYPKTVSLKQESKLNPVDKNIHLQVHLESDDFSGVIDVNSPPTDILGWEWTGDEQRSIGGINARLLNLVQDQSYTGINDRPPEYAIQIQFPRGGDNYLIFIRFERSITKVTLDQILSTFKFIQ